jgi:predicted phosphodiesterase
MKVDYISDIHLDFWMKKSSISEVCDMLEISGGELLIIAGDLGHIFGQNTAFLYYLNKLYHDIVFVHGNHDLYNVHKDSTKTTKVRINALKSFCNTVGIHFLDGETVEINGVKIGGTCSFWDDSFYQMLTGTILSQENMVYLYKKSLNDARFIRDFDPVKFQKEQFGKLSSIDPVDIMVTHYAPVIPPNLKREYATSHITTFYYADKRSEVVRIDPKFWIFGHTHDKMEFNYNNTTFLCNPVGYPMENKYTKMESFQI